MLNKIELIGSLGKDPEVKNRENGEIIVSFSVATSEKWKDKQGQPQSRTQWHGIVIFQQNLAKLARDYLKKGNKAYFCGTMEYRKYTDKNNVERDISEILLKDYSHKIILLTPKKEQDSSPNQEAHTASYDNETDDEIPF